MPKLPFHKLHFLAPYSLVAGIAAFAVAYITAKPIAKDALLLAGLALVVAGVGLYVGQWKRQGQQIQ